jgi:hypothetical protein
LTNPQTRTIISIERPNMLRKITFYDETEAIQYQLKMRQLGYMAKMIHPEGKYEVVVAGEAADGRVPQGLGTQESWSDAPRQRGKLP